MVVLTKIDMEASWQVPEAALVCAAKRPPRGRPLGASPVAARRRKVDLVCAHGRPALLEGAVDGRHSQRVAHGGTLARHSQRNTEFWPPRPSSTVSGLPG